MTSINDVVINKNILLEKVLPEPTRWHPRVIDLVDHSCRVKLVLPFEDAQSGVATVLFQDCNTNVLLSPCRSYSAKTDYFTIPRGCHHAIVLYNNATYLKMDSINLQSHYNIVADMSSEPLHAADSVSTKWLYTHTNNCFTSEVAASRTITFQQRRNSTGNLQGAVLDDMNYELPGATIVVKGTTIGVVTDVNGRFILDIPEDPSTLIVSFIGYVTQEIEVRPGTDISIVMQADIQQLQEVVVIGYGEQSKRELTGSVSMMLSGKVAGVSVSHTTMDQDTEPETNRIAEQTREAEQKLYQELLALTTIRSDFSDVGFWEPRLWTDRQGKCTFTVTFPDDLTRWDAIVYGMNRRLQTGTVRRSIKSYKPLMAEFHAPQFLTIGDSANFVGKVLNYTSDKMIEGTTQWSGPAAKSNIVTFDSYHNETLAVTATSSDTITTRYSFTRNDGYLDGEERKVPVIEQGTIRANGTLSMLKNGDQLLFKSKNGEVANVEIFDNQLDLYAGEVQWLIHYRYDCNEQLASKLIGLLNYKLLMRYEGKPFKHDKDVNRIIERLLRNQNSEFLWSWWDVSSNTSNWMSAHILRALKAAKDGGYVVNLDLANVARKARYKFEFLKDVSLNDVQLIHALATWNTDLDYAGWVRILDDEVRHYDSVAREDKWRYRYGRYSTLNEKLMLLEVRQLQHLHFVPDSLLHYKKETILNEVYFADDLRSRNWYSGELSSNAIAYRIVSRDSILKPLTVPMQMYFLSLRKNATWNTYEASNVLMSILPDVITQGSTKRAAAKVSLAGKVNADVQRFPFKIELREGEELQINKVTGLPLYCMQYTQKRVTTAQAGTDAFKISTTFDQKTLKAGSPAILKCTVELTRDADLEHVMIEIPIPGGCSYGDKRQFDNPIEAHREHFKDRTVIFCQKMTAGTYVFQVQLLPRFTGSYHVNPAQVSLMYFPVINANTDMEKVKIAE